MNASATHAACPATPLCNVVTCYSRRFNVSSRTGKNGLVPRKRIHCGQPAIALHKGHPHVGQTRVKPLLKRLYVPENNKGVSLAASLHDAIGLLEILQSFQQVVHIGISAPSHRMMWGVRYASAVAV